MNSLFIQSIDAAKTIGITGHIRPDGDCIGSTTGLYNYIRHNYPDKEVMLFIERIPEEMAQVLTVPEYYNGEDFDKVFDLFVSLDASTPDRLGPNLKLFEKAGLRFVVDHHKTNLGFGDLNHILPDASSCCEVLYDMLEEDKIDLPTANSLYLGIVHDTGVFKYYSTTRHTMEIGGKLLDYGVCSAEIIDGSFYDKTWNQNKLLGIALNKAEQYLDGYVAATIITRADLAKVNCTMYDTDGIVEQLRYTRETEVAVFVREDGDDYYKFSLRAKHGDIDVSKISVMFEGGGHTMAAGFSAYGKIDELMDKLISIINDMRKLNKE